MIEIRALTYNEMAPVMPIAGTISGNDGTIGRAANNTIVLPDPWNMVSRQHLRFSLQPEGTYKVRNVSEENMVFVNGEELKSGIDHVVNDNDKISVGGYVLEVHYVKKNKANAVSSSFLSAPTTNTSETDDLSDDLLMFLFGHDSSTKFTEVIPENDNLLDLLMQRDVAPIRGDPARILSGHSIELGSLDGKNDELINGKDNAKTTIHELLHDPFSSVQQLYNNETNDPLATIEYETSYEDVGAFDEILQTNKKGDMDANIARMNLTSGSQISGLFHLPKSNSSFDDSSFDILSIAKTQEETASEFGENLFTGYSDETDINQPDVDIDNFFSGIVVPDSSVPVREDTSLQSEIVSDQEKSVSKIQVKTADEQIETKPLSDTVTSETNIYQSMIDSDQSVTDTIASDSTDTITLDSSIFSHDDASLQSTVVLDQEEHVELQTATELQWDIVDAVESVQLPVANDISNDVVSINGIVEEDESFTSGPTLADLSVVVSLSMKNQPSQQASTMAQMTLSSQTHDHYFSEEDNEIDSNNQSGVDELYHSILENISSLENKASQKNAEKLYRAFCEGLGIHIPNRTVMDEGFMKFLGQLLRNYTQGTLEMIAGRAVIKQEVRANVTVIAPERNNPLKFSPNTEAALSYLLGKSLPGFMKPVEAIQNAFVDLCAHQIGIVSGTKTALSHVFDNFDPALIAGNMKRKGLLYKMLPIWAKARLWEEYESYFKLTRENAKDHFQDFCGFVFLKAYMEATTMLQSNNADVKEGKSK